MAVVGRHASRLAIMCCTRSQSTAPSTSRRYYEPSLLRCGVTGSPRCRSTRGAPCEMATSVFSDETILADARVQRSEREANHKNMFIYFQYFSIILNVLQLFCLCACEAGRRSACQVTPAIVSSIELIMLGSDDTSRRFSCPQTALSSCRKKRYQAFSS